MTFEELVEYIKFGIEHYNDEINLLSTTSERSTKYMYNKGAIDALENILLCATKKEETSSEEVTVEEEKSITTVKNDSTEVKYSKFTGVIPTNFEYPKSAYDYLTTNKNNPVYAYVDGTEVYKEVGTCEVGIVNKIIYLRGEIEDKYPCNGAEHIILALYKQNGTPLFVITSGEKNYQQVK